MAWSLYKREVESFGEKINEIIKKNDLTYEKKFYSSIELFYDFYDRNPTKFSFILLSQNNFPKKLKLNNELNPFFILREFLTSYEKNKNLKIEDIELMSGMIYGLILEPAKMKSTKLLNGKLKDRTEKVYKACINILKS